MKRFIRRSGLCLFVAAFLPQGGYAAEQTKISHVTAVYPQANGSFVISLADEPLACTSAYVPKRMHVKVGENSVTADAAKQMYAAALVALATDLFVFVVYDDATSSCFINRLQVYKG